jgi:hypothetical protein
VLSPPTTLAHRNGDAMIIDWVDYGRDGFRLVPLEPLEPGDDVVVTVNSEQHAFTVTTAIEHATLPQATVRVYATQFSPRGLVSEGGVEANYQAVAVITLDVPGALRVGLNADGAAVDGFVQQGAPLLLDFRRGEPCSLDGPDSDPPLRRCVASDRVPAPSLGWGQRPNTWRRTPGRRGCGLHLV